MANTFYWHDYETFGVDPAKDRPSQFAGLRTDEELNSIGDPLVIYCQPQRDILPSAQACLLLVLPRNWRWRKGFQSRILFTLYIESYRCLVLAVLGITVFVLMMRLPDTPCTGTFLTRTNVNGRMEIHDGIFSICCA